MEHTGDAVLTVLADGRAWTPTELAGVTGEDAVAVAAVVQALIGAGAIERLPGRHGYVRRPAAAASPPDGAAMPSPGARRAGPELCAGRSCRGHLAGDLGMAVTMAWHGMGVLTPDWAVTDDGREWFDAAGVPAHTAGPRHPERAELRPCLDWTCRRDHAAGALADAFLSRGFAAGWFARGRHPRSVHVTDDGRTALARLGVIVP